VKSNMRSSPRWDMQVGLIVVFFLCCYNLISNIIQSDKIGCHHVDVWFFLNADSAKQMVLSGKPV